MVGFNRRFVPMYVAAKEQANTISWIRIEKHRTNKVGPNTYDFTMLDDYLHIVDTARWLANDDLNVVHNMMQINEKMNFFTAIIHIQQQTDYYFQQRCTAMLVQI